MAMKSQDPPAARHDPLFLTNAPAQARHVGTVGVARMAMRCGMITRGLPQNRPISFLTIFQKHNAKKAKIDKEDVRTNHITMLLG